MKKGKIKNILLTCALSLSTLGGAQTIIPASTLLPARKVDTERIMSYNVRNCRGMDDVLDYQRIADIINRVSPDAVAIQELDSVTGRSSNIFVLKELADRTNMNYTYGAAIDYDGGKYGIGILCKEKPLRTWSIPLPGREERRCLLMVELNDYILACTHFSLTPEDQIASVPLIKSALKDIKKPLFLAGDINAKYDTEVQAALRNDFITLNDPTVPTIPSTNPEECIDFIYGYKNGHKYKVLNATVMTEEKLASDHLPVFVDVQVE